MKRIGPELKMPKLGGGGFKAPPFAADLYHDLRDRRLLPLIALVIVAIAAVPFLLASDAEEPTLPPEGMTAIEELKAESAEPASLTVVEAKPGLRDYRRRLRGRTPTDPFEQRYTAPVLNGADLPEPEGGGSDGGEGAGSEGGGKTTTVTTTDGDGRTGGGDGGGSGGDGELPEQPVAPPVDDDGDGAADRPGIVLYSFAIDLRVVRTSGEGASKETSEPKVMRRVMPTTPLPGKNAQVVTYMGISPKTRKPTFLVSTEVTAMFGEGKCAAGTEVCQLVELEPGFPQTFVFGEAGTRYKFKILDVRPVETGRL